VTSDECQDASQIKRYPFKRTAISAVNVRSIVDELRTTQLASCIMIKHIKFVSIPVANQNRALDFYTDKLGFTIITDQPFDEKQRWIELRIPKAETRVVLFTPEGDEKRIGSFMNISYTCDDIDKTYEELKNRGVEFEGPPQKQPWGTYAMFKDSEQNSFVLSSD
jgi:predicted enzyme related to lactoylglutathione lyase